MREQQATITISPIAPGTAAYTEAARVRYDALYREWGLPRTLVDDVDGRTYLHIVARDAERIVGYARIALDAEEPQIYQVAVARDRRGEGIGSLLVQSLLREARAAGHTEVYLDARVHVIAFYEALGFEMVGEEFLSARTHTPHRRMRRELGDDL